jgi:hypothetical protein
VRGLNALTGTSQAEPLARRCALDRGGSRRSRGGSGGQRLAQPRRATVDAGRLCRRGYLLIPRVIEREALAVGARGGDCGRRLRSASASAIDLFSVPPTRRRRPDRPRSSGRVWRSSTWRWSRWSPEGFSVSSRIVCRCDPCCDGRSLRRARVDDRLTQWCEGQTDQILHGTLPGPSRADQPDGRLLEEGGEM